MQANVNDAEKACEDVEKPSSFKTKIGSTTYHVTVHFSKTSKETLQDKLLRMIVREAQDKDSPSAD